MTNTQVQDYNMATTEELLKRKKVLEANIAAVAKVDITSTTAAARLASMKATEKDRKELAEINRQLSGQPKTPPKSTSKAPLPKPIAIAENAPAGITQDLAADLAAQGFNIGDAAIWQQGGMGSTALVYLGETNKPGQGLVFKNGKPVSSVVPDLKPTTTVATDFWNDQALQSKIIGAYAAKGKTISTVEAYGLWSQLVTTAATIYQGGRGPKITPLQLLTDSLKGVKGDEATLPTRSVSKLDRGIFNEFMDKLSQGELGMNLTDDVKNKYYEEFNRLNTGTLTEYKKVKNPKTGKLENVQTTTPGLTEADMTARAREKLKKENPQQYELNMGLNFVNDFKSIMAGGI